MYHWRQSWRTRVVNNTVYQFVSFDLGVEILLKKREHQKRVRWNTRLRLLCTLCIGVSRKFHLHFTLMFYLRYYKMVQSLYKNWLLVSKITWGIWKTSDKQWKVQNSKLNGLLLPKNYISSAKTLYAVDLSNITFNYLCVDSPNYLCHFWNHKSFFTTQLLCIFLVQIFRLFHCSG